MTLLNVELSPSELALLMTALIIFKDCKYCEQDSPRIHRKVVRKILPKTKKVAKQKFGEPSSFDQQIQFLYDETRGSVSK